MKLKTSQVLPVLSVLGLVLGIYTVVSGNQPVPVAEPVVEPAAAPFRVFIAGSGIIEARNRNIAIGAPLSGIVTELAVKVGDSVKVGALLFALDDRVAKAELTLRQADLARAEAEAAVAAARFQDAESLRQVTAAVTDKRAISGEELLRRGNAVAVAHSELAVARAAVQQARAQVGAAAIVLDKLRVRAPVDGEVLQVNLRPGEFAQAEGQNAGLLVLGDLKQLHVRVDIDENDAWRFAGDRKAVAFVRGNSALRVDLQLAYVEPFVVPKKSLTGDSGERVDTRVLQVLYRFDRKQLPIYVGQQMDVFIESGDAAGAAL